MVSQGGHERRGFWTRFWEFAEEYPLGPVDWLWTKIKRRAPGLSGPLLIVVGFFSLMGVVIASDSDLGEGRWVILLCVVLVPLLGTLAIVGAYKLIRDAIVRRIHK